MHEQVAVAVLCETHCGDDEQARDWEREGAGPGRPWLGHAAWHHGTRQSRGVAILVDHRYVSGDLAIAYVDGMGRVLLAGFTDGAGVRWQVMAVYAPAEVADRAAFFAGPFTAACAARDPAARLLVAGDFNCVLELADLQQVEGALAAQNSRLVGSVQLRQAMQATGLVDVWRQLHPGEKAFTRTTMSVHGASAGRTSMWLVDEGLQADGWAMQCAHKPGHLPGDHHAVGLQLAPPTQPHWGQGYWAFPLHLLGVPHCVSSIKGRILQARAQAAAQGMSAAETWEAIKAEVGLHTTALAYQLAAERRAQRRQLQRAANAAVAAAAQRPTAAGAAQRAGQAVRALQAYDEERGDREEVALGALWEAYGEQGTAWFHRLGREPPGKSPMLAVAPPGGGPPISLTTPQGASQAGEALAAYFDGHAPAGLYRPRPVSAAAQGVLLGSIDRVLSPAAQRACCGPSEDGRMTAGELWEALVASPAGKAPGNDGLPYEAYHAFWEELKDPLVAAFNEPFLSDAAQPQLHLSALVGVIVLLYKGGDKPRESPDSYRPITLQNCDVKLVAKVLARRLGLPLSTVIDPTQTAFVPGRWIGDNVLSHLEAVEHFAAAHESACVVGLDFAKAYDRVDRGWLGRCMEALGVPAPARRWVQLLLAGTQGMVLYNGHLSPAFAILSGCAQGSPLSPLMYVVSSQPLASRCRQLVLQGLVAPLLLPGGAQAAPMHQHADDTTIHTRSAGDAAVVIEEAVQPYCAASGAEVSLPKSWGMTLGAHPVLVGPHAATGVPFVAPGKAVRHLGVPLVAGGAGDAVRAVYDAKLRALRGRVRRWSRFKLTLLGRVHVAKQVLASVVSYHATFLPIPADQLQAMARVIHGYIRCERLVEQADGQLFSRPAHAVAALPRSQGGVGEVDLGAFVQSLLAKVPAMLLHPRAAQWKGLFRRALQGEFPSHGVRALVYPQRLGAHPQHLSPRQVGYVRAWWGLPLVRHVPHSDMSLYQVQAEGLVGNASVCRPDGRAFPTEQALPSAARGRGTLGALPHEVLQSLVMPPPWRAALEGPAPLGWQVRGDGVAARRREAAGWTTFDVLPSGQLREAASPPLADAGAPGPAHQWHPACVVSTPSSSRGEGPDFFLVGRWAEAPVDPSVWAVGGTPVLQYKVREATAALIMLGAKSAPGWVMGRGVRPKLWGGTPTPTEPADPDAVRALGERQLAGFAAAQQQAGSSRGGSRVRATDQGAALYDASWLHPSPQRASVRQRVEEQQSVVTHLREMQQRQLLPQVQGPRVDDTVWGQAGPVAWSAAWRRLCHRRVPRATQVFGWRLLHAALACGGARVAMIASTAELQHCLCAAPCCAHRSPRPLETLHHLYLECAVGRGALKWLAGLWGLLDPGGGPVPLEARVWLADDLSAWQPSQGLIPLWTLLRLTMLQSVWRLRCAACRGRASAFTRSAAIGAFVREVRGLIRQDWARVEGDVRLQAGVPPSWFRGRDPTATLAQFSAGWCANGVLARVQVPPPPGRPLMAVAIHIYTVPNQWVAPEAPAHAV